MFAGLLFMVEHKETPFSSDANNRAASELMGNE